jgi:hypothetical protein
MPDENKRGAERVEILGNLQGEIMVFQRLTIKEISRSGASIETAFSLHLDSLHDLRLTLGDRAVVVKARVAHCRIADMDQGGVVYRSGVEFVEPPEHIIEAISGFIDALREERAGS